MSDSLDTGTRLTPISSDHSQTGIDLWLFILMARKLESDTGFKLSKIQVMAPSTELLPPDPTTSLIFGEMKLK
jgi:hypothetical protein